MNVDTDTKVASISAPHVVQGPQCLPTSMPQLALPLLKMHVDAGLQMNLVTDTML